MIVCHLAHFSLNLAEHDHLMRNYLYRHLRLTLVCQDVSRPVDETWYIIQTIKLFSVDTMQEVMPFVQFCIRSDKHLDPIISEADKRKRRIRWISLKNSLIIRNHFQTNLNH